MEISRADVDRALKIAAWYGRKIGWAVEQENLDGAALEGLARAAKKWDGERDFWTFAAKTIFGAIRDELRRADHLTRRQRKATGDGGEVDGMAYIRPAAPISMNRRVANGGNPSNEITLEDTVEERRSALADAELRDALLRALERVPARERAALLLVDLEGYPNQDVAAWLGVSAGRVTQLRTRAYALIRAQFHDCLEDAA